TGPTAFYALDTQIEQRDHQGHPIRREPQARVLTPEEADSGRLPVPVHGVHGAIQEIREPQLSLVPPETLDEPESLGQDLKFRHFCRNLATAAWCSGVSKDCDSDARAYSRTPEMARVRCMFTARFVVLSAW